MTPKERSEVRRIETERAEAENHAAGRHRGTFVTTCKACIRERER